MLLGDAPRNTYDARAFMQSRLSYFARVGVFLDIGFLCVVALVAALHTTLTQQLWLNLPWHLGFIGVGVLTWLVTRGRPLGNRTLVAVDCVSTLSLCSLFMAMAFGMRSFSRPDLFSILGVTQFLCARAVYVPSSPVRTAALSSVSLCPALLFAYLYYADNALKGTPVALSYAAMDALCAGVSVIVATLTSRTIYGLRVLIREAAQFGQYTLTEKIGEGGMGVVYKARHAMLRRPTALKLLPLDRASARDSTRFEREVQQTSLLTHPNTVSIFDYGRTQDGVFYYAMEYLDGFDLNELVEHAGGIPAARVIHILQQVCGALREAHEHGLTHRDIKPANIVLCERGGIHDVAKVLDFGLVKVTDAHDEHETHAHTLLGTPLYMSPEAILNHAEVGPLSDLYALGALGYYLLTGSDVFQADTVVAVCAQHLTQEPEHPSSLTQAPVPEDLARLLLQCLEKRPEARPSSAEALQAALLACADAGSWTQEDARRWWKGQREPMQDARRRRLQAASDPSEPRALTVHLERRKLAEQAFVSPD